MARGQGVLPDSGEQLLQGWPHPQHRGPALVRGEPYAEDRGDIGGPEGVQGLHPGKGYSEGCIGGGGGGGGGGGMGGQAAEEGCVRREEEEKEEDKEKEEEEDTEVGH